MRIDSQRTPVLYRPLPAGFEAAKMAAYGCIARFQRALEAARMAAVRLCRPLPAGFGSRQDGGGTDVSPASSGLWKPPGWRRYGCIARFQRALKPPRWRRYICVAGGSLVLKQTAFRTNCAKTKSHSSRARTIARLLPQGLSSGIHNRIQCHPWFLLFHSVRLTG